MRIFDSCADDLGDPVEEVGKRGGELVTANESTVIAKALFDTVVVEDS